MVPLLSGAYELAIARLEGQQERDAARIQKLEEERDAAAERERSHLSQEREAAMMTTQLEAEIRRKDKVFNVFTERAVPIFLKKFGLDADPKIARGLKLLSSMRRDQLLMLLGIDGMVTEEQKIHIREFLGELTPEEKEAIGESVPAATNKEETA